MIKKLRSLWNKHVKYKGVSLTPKGECFKEYCEQIVNDTLNDSIQSYEDILYDTQDILLKDHKIFLDRKEAAEFILATYEEIL